MQQDNNTNRRRLILAVVLLLVAGVIVYLAFLRPFDSNGQAIFKAKTPPLAADQYCSLEGLALNCQDIGTGKAAHYRLPHDIGFATQILPSPDGNQYFVDTPANSLTTTGSQLLLTDKNFKTTAKLPNGDQRNDFGGFDWSADSKQLFYTYGKAGEAGLFAYDVAAGKATRLGTAIDVTVPRVSADGKQVFVQNRPDAQAGKLSLKAIDSQNGKFQEIDSSQVTSQLQSVANFAYSRSTNLFYIVGTAPKDFHPVFTVAKLTAASGKLTLVTVKAISDGNAYVPLVSAGTGMLASRQIKDKTDYVVVGEDGSIKQSPLKPQPYAQFGLHGSLSITPVKGKLTADDFIYGYVAVPSALQSFLRKEAATGCTNSFNSLQLLAQDNSRQAAVKFTSCNQATTTKYYVADAGSYKQVIESLGVLNCSDVQRLGLSKVVVPKCANDVGEGITGSPKAEPKNERAQPPVHTEESLPVTTPQIDERAGQ